MALAYRPYQMAQIIDEATDIRTFVFSPTDGQPVPSFLPGQFFNLRPSGLPADFKPNFHSYSAARTSRPDSVSFGIKKHGPFTQHLFTLSVGAPVEIMGPFGVFTLPKPIDYPLVFLAGGIGITPFLCMTEHLTDTHFSKPYHLFYGNWTEEGIAYRKLLDSFSARHSNFHVIHSLSGENIPASWMGERGFLSVEMFKRAGVDLSTSHFYVCGPKGFIDAMMAQLGEAGVPKERLHKEVW